MSRVDQSHGLWNVLNEIVVPDDRAAQVVETVMKSAHTGRIGDGKIFVYDLEQIHRIRTGETDQDAL